LPVIGTRITRLDQKNSELELPHAKLTMANIRLIRLGESDHSATVRALESLANFAIGGSAEKESRR
jgi:hypothetical protein